MPISSVSRTFDVADPVMENDLELMAKVDTYQQGKFDSGAAALQNEVNNWALMSNIAKPELKQYANEKLNKLVSGINNLGGVNLGDINNVNSLKSLGYNIYGDSRIMDGVATTQRMKTLAANSQSKLSGKDAKNYDPAVADYLMKGYSEWANDGNVDNTKYEGSVDLPMGNMNLINEKVQKYLKALTPDSDSIPSGDLQKSYGYFQVDGKWLKGNRIQEAIDAVTDENDAVVFRSHGWKALGSDTDNGLISKVGLLYDTAAAANKAQINFLQAELNQTTDAPTKIELQKLIGEQKQAIVNNQKEKDAFSSKQQLSPQERESIQESLYKNAWRSNIVNSYSYNQEKKELKTNMPLVFHDRIQNQAQQWAADYNLDVAQYQLDVRKQDFEESKNALNNPLTGGRGNLPLTQEPNTGKNNEQKSPAGFIDDINGTYFKENARYYQYLYNTMGANDTAGRFEQVNGSWKPKEQYRNQIDKEIEMVNTKLDNYSNLTEKEKQALNLPFSKDELKDVFNQRSIINTYKAYSKMASDKEDEIINTAIATNKIPFDWRNISVRVDTGSGTKDMTIQEVLALSNGDNPIYGDNIKITGVPGVKYPKSTGKVDQKQFIAPKSGVVSRVDNIPYTGSVEITDNNYQVHNIKSLKSFVKDLRESSEKSYKDKGGKLFNSFSVPIPFAGLNKITQDVIKKQLTSKVNTPDFDKIEPISGEIQMNFKTGKPEYFMKIQSGTGKKVKTEDVNVTELVTTSPSTGIGAFFPQSDISLVWGLSLSNTGSTPFSKQNGYKDALRTQGSNYPYQISSLSNAVNGTVGLKVKIALPIGNGNTVEVNVKNVQNGSTTFPSSIEAVQKYLDDWMSTPELKARFYKEHGLTLN